MSEQKTRILLSPNKVILSRDVLQQLPKLKLIALTATAPINVDLDAAKELGVTVKNVKGSFCHNGT